MWRRRILFATFQAIRVMCKRLWRHVCKAPLARRRQTQENGTLQTCRHKRTLPFAGFDDDRSVQTCDAAKIQPRLTGVTSQKVLDIEMDFLPFDFKPKLPRRHLMERFEHGALEDRGGHAERFQL